MIIRYLNYKPGPCIFLFFLHGSYFVGSGSVPSLVWIRILVEEKMKKPLNLSFALFQLLSPTVGYLGMFIIIACFSGLSGLIPLSFPARPSPRKILDKLNRTATNL